MKKLIVLLMVCGTAMAAPYFGAYKEQVHHSLHPARNILEDTFKDIGIAISESPNWTGTNKQAHNLVRRSVITSHNINVPAGSDLDAVPTQVDFLASALREKLLNQGYSEADANTLVTQFRTLTHPQD